VLSASASHWTRLITIPDTFHGIYAASNLPVKGRDAFLCSGVWASIDTRWRRLPARRSARAGGPS
jgi:hypothetical protein